MPTLSSGFIIEETFSLKPLTSWLVGGTADFCALPTTVEQLQEAWAWALSKGLPVTVLSGGTNVLVSDKGVRGLVIALKNFVGAIAHSRDGRFSIECFSGTSKSELLKLFLKAKLEPALFLAGIPGDVGGGVAMNAGVGEKFGPREFTEIVDWIEVLRPSVSRDGSFAGFDTVRFAHDDLEWSYRHCEGWKPGIITRVGISWPLDVSPDVLARVRSANQIRLSKQPLDMPSCGSVFRNPEGHTSGRLIEAAGLKGFSVGGAMVSPKHANFIVNTGDSTAADMHAVIEHVKATVLAKDGIALRTEVVYLGEF